MRPLRLLTAALLCASIAGCGGIVRAYDGPPRRSQEVAILKTNVGELTFDTVWVDRVDERTLIRAYSELEVAPGPHILRVQLNRGMIKANTTIPIEAEAGHAYRVRGTLGRQGPIAWIEDEAAPTSAR